MSTWVVSLAAGVLSLLGTGQPAAETAELSAEHAARLYRIEVYNTFRNDRSEYDHRRALGDQVWAAFDAAGQPQHHRSTVTQWYIAAREASTAPQIGALPTIPDLTRPDQVTSTTAEDTHPVATSVLPERVPMSPIPSDVVTTLDIQLPPGAEPVGTSGFFSTLVKSVFEAAHGSPEKPSPPTTVELPRAVKEAPAPITETKIEPAPAVKPESAEPAPAPKTEAPQPVAQPTPAADSFDVKDLFEPATVPAETTEAATDADPFAP